MSYAESASSTRPSPGLPHELEIRIRDVILQELSSEQRLLLMLWYAEQMNPAEIGHVLNLPKANVLQMHDSIVGHLRERAESTLAPTATA